MPEGAPVDATPTPTDPTTPAESNPAEQTHDAPLGAAGEKALAEWKDRARQAEREAKATRSELTKLQQSSMSDTEKAVAEAEERGRNAAMAEVGKARVDDAVRLALAGRSLDVDALLEGLDRSQFLDDAFQPDRDAIEKWANRIAPAPTETEPGAPLTPFDLGQGTRESTPIGDDKAFERMLTDLVK